jgi:hypothetical protein
MSIAGVEYPGVVTAGDDCAELELGSGAAPGGTHGLASAEGTNSSLDDCGAAAGAVGNGVEATATRLPWASVGTTDIVRGSSGFPCWDSSLFAAGALRGEEGFLREDP